MRRSARLSARKSISYVSESEDELFKCRDELSTPIIVRKTRASLGSSTVRRTDRLKKLAKTIFETEESEAQSISESHGDVENAANLGLEVVVPLNKLDLEVNERKSEFQNRPNESSKDVSPKTPKQEAKEEEANVVFKQEIIKTAEKRKQEVKEKVESKKQEIIRKTETKPNVSPSFQILSREEENVETENDVPKKVESVVRNVRTNICKKILEQGTPLAERKPSKKYNFSMGNSSTNEGNLLKLTSDIFKNLPFKISKEDILGVNPGKKFHKKEPTDVHKLDIISLDSSEKEANQIKINTTGLSSELDPKIDTKDLYFDVDSKTAPVKFKQDKKSAIEDAVMKKSVLKSGLEKQESAPIVNESMTQKIKQKRKEKGETAGPGWFNLPKTEITEELKKDFQIIKMRNVLDPKRYYKKASKKMPTYFQVGRVVENATEFYSSRIPKKERKRTMVDELLEDADFRRKNKKKYLEIQKKKESGGKKYFKKMKNKKKPTWAKK